MFEYRVSIVVFAETDTHLVLTVQLCVILVWGHSRVGLLVNYQSRKIQRTGNYRADQTHFIFLHIFFCYQYQLKKNVLSI